MAVEGLSSLCKNYNIIIGTVIGDRDSKLDAALKEALPIHSQGYKRKNDINHISKNFCKKLIECQKFWKGTGHGFSMTVIKVYY